MYRIALGGLYQESHSFSPAPADREQFEAGYLLYGSEIFEALSDNNHEIGGAFQTAHHHSLIPLVYGATGASGMPLRAGIFNTLCDQLCDRVRASLPLDGVYLAMHGAMACEHIDDATGHVLARIREIVGTRIPIVASLDLHANVTRLMARTANALVGYHTAPHIDQSDTGRRAMSLLLKVLEKNAHPTMAHVQLPMILAPENGMTTTGPFSEVMDMVKSVENMPRVLAASAYPVQPWMDLPEMGCSVLVVTDNDPELGQREAQRIARAFWDRRERFAQDLLSPQDIIRDALTSSGGPHIVSDSSDAPSSGAPGDSTTFLRACLDADIRKMTLINILDPLAVKQAQAVGIGNTFEFTLGASLSSTFYGPIQLTATVRSLSDGKFTNKGPGFRGFEFNMGPTAVLVYQGIHLVVMSLPVIQWDPELYRSQGLDPAAATLVAVKSPAAFRAAYEPLAGKVIILDAPGVCSPNLKGFPWARINRPIYPLDPVVEPTWSPL
ncbi:MAG: M81 family metallopeptidase [bacterium]|jgi:microcystin degradation protein MlrC|nr:M81 family metallopeptidase [bacterium]